MKWHSLKNSLFFTAVAILLAAKTFAQHYIPSQEGSDVKFKIKNFGITVTGSFKGLQGSISFDEKNISTAAFDVTVESATINTGVGARDRHLKKDEYFDVVNHPKIRMKSTKITPADKEGWLYFFGTLTIKGITKEISFPFKVRQQNEGLLFTADFKMNRRDYKVGGNSFSLADNLIVYLSVFAKKP
ncbi:MAG TPA: YceI family protein [Chitinophagaceae bacterium]|nr:YceI family protein [Chitinophagaceae bacterium]